MRFDVGHHCRRLTPILAACCTLLLPNATKAAEITHKALSNGDGLITIEGSISSGDLERFRQISLKYKRAIVGLNSNGGQLMPAIEIGKIIKIAGFVTVVPKDSVCASSCALIWMAGSKRLLSPTGHVGFHASYRDNNGKLEESGVANALIGNYLTLLGLPEKAIIFATTAPPNSILWLTKANKGMAGIDFDDFGTDTSPESPRQLIVPPTPAPISLPHFSLEGTEEMSGGITKYKVKYYNQKMSIEGPSGANVQDIKEAIDIKLIDDPWIKYSEDKQGTLYYFNFISIKTINNNTSVWIREDHSQDKTITHRQTKVLFNISCENETFFINSTVHYDKKGNIIYSNDSISPQSRIIPDTIGGALWDAVCKN